MKKILIVTGASSGMGWEFARQLASTRRADELWLIARRKGKLASLAQILEKQDVPPAGNRDGKPAAKRAAVKIIPMDISGQQGAAAFAGMLAQERENAGPYVIDTLVCNAGFGVYGPFADAGLQRQLDMIELNVTSLTGVCGASLPFMEQGSRIINIASLAAFAPLGNFAVYAATKAYVHSFTLALAAETADKGIKVLSVCPGPVATEFAAVASNGARTEVLHGKEPAKVVAHTLRCADRNKKVAVYAYIWKLKAFLSGCIGKYTIARCTYKYDKRPFRSREV